MPDDFLPSAFSPNLAAHLLALPRGRLRGLVSRGAIRLDYDGPGYANPRISRRQIERILGRRLTPSDLIRARAAERRERGASEAA